MKNNRIHLLRAATFGAVAAMALALATSGHAAQDDQQAHAAHAQKIPAKLVDLVRLATRPYQNIDIARAANYGAFLGCITGPDHGAMGIHYVNGALVGDGEIDVNKPEALIYEPTATGMKLVGVEYIVDAATWMGKHNNTPPVLEGQSFQFVSSPNRYGLAAFFELHVWAWRDNPDGAFHDWNAKVSCEGQ
jgi:hypothetical protein